MKNLEKKKTHFIQRNFSRFWIFSPATGTDGTTTNDCRLRTPEFTLHRRTSHPYTLSPDAATSRTRSISICKETCIPLPPSLPIYINIRSIYIEMRGGWFFHAPSQCISPPQSLAINKNVNKAWNKRTKKTFDASKLFFQIDLAGSNTRLMRI